ncbi:MULTISPECIES: peptidase M14 [unclassified Vibrio]|uniref:Peptidase M14 n=1 Tax=Vibrio sp. HB236076 TaxID=3232307 RepID=A0AB39HEU7_9VIBR|nr:peptidase M14 [Vibrio sp. HB161653]MDP5255376.1 peptidase M14 [Vibrio sp. HB161653]
MRLFKDNNWVRPNMSIPNAHVSNAHVSNAMSKAQALATTATSLATSCPDKAWRPYAQGEVSLVRQTLSSTLTQWVDYLCQPAFRHHHIEMWVFNDQKTRRRAETTLFKHGVHARIHSAYKPFVHFLFEDLSQADRERFNHPDSTLVVHYPSDAFGSDKRFALETYPFGSVFDRANIEFTPRDDQQLHYQLTLKRPHCEPIHYDIFAPNAVKTSITGQTSLSPTGWIKISDPDHRPLLDERVYCDYEQIFDSAISQLCDALSERPHFERLMIEVQAPLLDEPLGVAHEHISLREGLHEDFYFTLQEWCKLQQGKSLQDRDAQFGQIIPNITYQDGDYHCHCYLSDYQAPTAKERAPLSGSEEKLALDTATKPLSSAQVATALAEIKGESWYAQSVSGRRVNAKYCQGSDHPVIISAGQHANESTGILGALRAAQQLSQQPGHHFVISPLENPDGYALYHDLLQANPTHMHHAARYTALGNDLEYHSSHQRFETAIRDQARQQTAAKLHINLHGYPAHEWVRPLSGYIPAGFADWTIPKGFFVIVRYQAHYSHLALAFIEYLTHQLAQNNALLAFNHAQLTAFQRHGGESPFTFINRIPCLLQKVADDALTPLQLITEFPDESIDGEAFCFGHQVQSDVVIKAYHAFQHCMNQASLSPPTCSSPKISI